MFFNFFHRVAIQITQDTFDDIEMVKTMIKEYFDPISMKDQYLVRQA